MISTSHLQTLPLEDTAITASSLDNKKDKKYGDIVTTDMPDYYKPPNEEDMYIPPGRKYFDREEIAAPEDELNTGPPVQQNDGIYRQ